MASTVDSSVEQRAIDFADPRFSSRGARYSYGDPFGVWSCKFSADGNEIIAGGSGLICGMSLVLISASKHIMLSD